MKTGKTVWVCNDGKFSRRVEGTVIKQTQYKILVMFKDSEDNYWSFWARKQKRRGKTFYTGWADVQNCVDWLISWFAVYEHGYKANISNTQKLFYRKMMYKGLI